MGRSSLSMSVAAMCVGIKLTCPRAPIYTCVCVCVCVCVRVYNIYIHTCVGIKLTCPRAPSSNPASAVYSSLA